VAENAGRPRETGFKEMGVAFSQRFQEIRRGFQSTFWVANITELFERLSYYGVNAVLAIYLHETLKFSQQQTGELIGFFGGVVWFLPIIGGTLADRLGFRRSLAGAYLVLTFGYFLLGSLSAAWMAPLRNALPLAVVVQLILCVPALGPAIVKPCVVGTTARASAENVRSLGYSIYYTLVNIGGTLGPIMAFAVRRTIGIENVFRVSAVCVLLMFFGTIFFFKEPDRLLEKQVASFAQAFKNMFVVLANNRFVTFELIFGFLGVLAGVHRASAFYPRLCESRRRRRSPDNGGSAGGHPVSDIDQLSHPQGSTVRRHDRRNSDHEPVVADPRGMRP
jgi:dipeptide/tripeptide permease